MALEPLSTPQESDPLAAGENSDPSPTKKPPKAKVTASMILLRMDNTGESIEQALAHYGITYPAYGGQAAVLTRHVRRALRLRTPTIIQNKGKIVSAPESDPYVILCNDLWQEWIKTRDPAIAKLWADLQRPQTEVTITKEVRAEVVTTFNGLLADWTTAIKDEWTGTQAREYVLSTLQASLARLNG